MAIKRITTNLIQDVSIGTIDIANNAITAAKITDGNITTAKLADLNVTAGKLAGTLDLTGKTVTVATATTGDSDTSPASTAFVQQEIAALVDSSPSSLNTLNELAAALGDDASFSTTVTNSIATKLPLAGGTLTGLVQLNADIAVGEDYKIRSQASSGGSHLMLRSDNLGVTGNSLSLIGLNDILIGAKSNNSGTGNIYFGVGSENKTSGWTDTLTILESGNVGIGTTNPANKLQITTSGAGSPYIGFNQVADNPYMEAQRWSGVSSTYYGTRLKNLTGDFVFETTDLANIGSQTFTEKMRLKANGNVGIGTSSPTRTFEVNSGTTNVAARFESTDSRSVVEFKDPSGTVELGGIGSEVYFAPAGIEKVRINSSGNVGIGTTNPSAKCHLFTSGSEAINIGIQNSQRYWKIETVSEKLNIADVSAGGAVRMTFDTSGNVGIGVSPSSEFHVKGDANTIARIEPNNNSGKATLLLSSTGSGDGGIQYDANSNLMHLFSYNYMTFNVGTGNLSGSYPANERMRITQDGKVGIGTAPSEMLHILGGGNGPEVRLQNSSSSHYIRAYNDNWNFLANSSNTAMTIKNSGQVNFGAGLGIGGTAAANTLDDYEEGSYDAAITCASGSITLYGSYNRLSYVKIGSLVHVQGKLAVQTQSSPTGATTINLPFAIPNRTDSAGTATQYMSGYFNGSSLTTGVYGIHAEMSEGSSVARLFVHIGTATNNLGDNYVGTGTDLWINLTYQTDS